MGFLAAIGAKAWGYLAAVGIVAATLFAAFGKGKSAGKAEVGGAVNEETAKANKAMLDASVNAPSDKKGLTDALRNPDRGI